MLKQRACALLLWTATISLALEARAAPQADSKPAVSPASQKDTRAQALTQARELLESDDPTKLQEGLQRLIELKEGVAVLIADRLRRGLPPQLADAAVDALVTLSDARAVPALLELTQHRRWQLRVKAIEALSTLHAQSIQSALLYALNDPVAQVRAASIAALGQVGDQRAIPAVLAAFDKQVEGAAITLGKLATPREMDALLAHVVGGDVTRVAPAFEQMLIRERFPVAAKLKLVAALVGFATPSSAACLAQARATSPEKADARVLSALNGAVPASPKVVSADSRVKTTVVVAAKGANQ